MECGLRRSVRGGSRLFLPFFFFFFSMSLGGKHVLGRGFRLRKRAGLGEGDGLLDARRRSRCPSVSTRRRSAAPAGARGARRAVRSGRARPTSRARLPPSAGDPAGPCVRCADGGGRSCTRSAWDLRRRAHEAAALAAACMDGEHVVAIDDDTLECRSPPRGPRCPALAWVASCGVLRRIAVFYAHIDDRELRRAGAVSLPS